MLANEAAGAAMQGAGSTAPRRSFEDQRRMMLSRPFIPMTADSGGASSSTSVRGNSTGCAGSPATVIVSSSAAVGGAGSPATTVSGSGSGSAGGTAPVNPEASGGARGN